MHFFQSGLSKSNREVVCDRCCITLASEVNLSIKVSERFNSTVFLKLYTFKSTASTKKISINEKCLNNLSTVTKPYQSILRLTLTHIFTLLNAVG